MQPDAVTSDTPRLYDLQQIDLALDDQEMFAVEHRFALRTPYPGRSTPKVVLQRPLPDLGVQWSQIGRLGRGTSAVLALPDDH